MANKNVVKDESGRFTSPDSTLYNVVIESINQSLLEPNDDCLLWEHSKRFGYGIVWNGEFTSAGTYRMITIHRMALEMKLGRKLQDGYESAHSCRNKNCYSPWHLSEKTPVGNAEDKYRDKTSMRQFGLRSDNKSGYKGVYWRKDIQKWQAYILIKGKPRVHIGYFITAEEAARAYDKAAFDAWGTDCFLNFPKVA